VLAPQGIGVQVPLRTNQKINKLREGQPKRLAFFFVTVAVFVAVAEE